MGRIRIVGWVLLVISAAWAVGCGDDGGASNPDGGGGGDSSVSMGGLATPASDTTTMGFGTVESLDVCQNLVIGGGIGWSLGHQCLGGAAYISFYNDAGEYSVSAGQLFHEDTSTDPVHINSTTAGSIVAGTEDSVTGIPADTDVTITTDEFTITFSISGSTVTVTAWEPV